MIHCPECHFPTAFPSQEVEQLTCTNCGLVIGENRISRTYFVLREETARTFKNSPNYGDILEFDQLSHNTLGFGIERNWYWNHLARINSNINSTERRYLFYVREMFFICKLIGAPKNVFLDAWAKYSRILKRGKVTNRMSLAATCVYYATKRQKFPCAIQDIITFYQSKGHKISAQLIFRDARVYNLNVSAVLKAEDYLLRAVELLFRSSRITGHLPVNMAPNELAGLLITQAKLILSADIFRFHGARPQNLAISALYFVYRQNVPRFTGIQCAFGEALNFTNQRIAAFAIYYKKPYETMFARVQRHNRFEVPTLGVNISP
jgi:transcription initiation factor TFIIIB Brf1 subunit/transcription initiation factor TFIIB